MARPCKVCTLDTNIRIAVDKMLLDKTSDSVVVDYLKVRDISISIPSVRRHRQGHLNDIPLSDIALNDVPETPSKGELVEPYIDLVNLSKELGMMTSEDLEIRLQEDKDLQQLWISNLTRNQYLIVLKMQSNYAKGDGHYPKEQIKDLKTLQTLQKDLDPSKKLSERVITLKTIKLLTDYLKLEHPSYLTNWLDILEGFGEWINERLNN